MTRIIDGDEDTPTQIADKLGLIGDEISLQDVQDVIDQVLEEKKTIVQKILRTGKTGPVMSLVGSVMQKLNKRGDPKLIQQMIAASIKEMEH